MTTEKDARIAQLEQKLMTAQADVTRAVIGALDHPETLVLPDIGNWLRAHDTRIREQALEEAIEVLNLDGSGMTTEDEALVRALKEPKK